MTPRRASVSRASAAKVAAGRRKDPVFHEEPAVFWLTQMRSVDQPGCFLPGGRDEDYAAERAVFPVERACCCGQEYHTGKDTKSENDFGRENVGGKLKML